MISAISNQYNLIGAVINAMVQSNFLLDDSSSYVVGCSGIFVKQRKRRNEQKFIGVLIRVYPASIKQLEDVLQTV